MLNVMLVLLNTININQIDILIFLDIWITITEI